MAHRVEEPPPSSSTASDAAVFLDQGGHLGIGHANRERLPAVHHDEIEVLFVPADHRSRVPGLICGAKIGQFAARNQDTARAKGRLHAVQIGASFPSPTAKRPPP